MKEYTPNPIDTSEIKLPESINSLIEMLAENSHEVWANQRIKDGWKYGTQRDDNKKTHPCLIPYEKLPEEEKVYDRNAAVETLKVIISLGFDIKSKKDNK